jgi:phosphoribosyl-AMP cyclohydrolase
MYSHPDMGRSQRSILAAALFGRLIVDAGGFGIFHADDSSNNSFNTRIDRLHSTPFVVDYYDDLNNNPFDETDPMTSSIAADPSTKLILGLTKYSHDTTICAAETRTGKVLFALSKERLTRKKHDAGNVAALVDKCLECLELDYDAIEKVVMNNHHHRILPLETDPLHMQWEAGLRINGGEEDGYDDDENLFPGIPKIELSHHLAHAYSTATQSPFDSGLVLVLDGMGDSFQTMYQAKNDSTYVSDFNFGEGSFSCVPSDIVEQAKNSCFDWREAESVYTFQKLDNTMEIKPVFKRFQQENSPPALYNHGFENMDRYENR